MVSHAATRWFVLGGFIALEHTNAQESVQRVLNALLREASSRAVPARKEKES